jgi:hypothetical protein
MLSIWRYGDLLYGLPLECKIKMRQQLAEFMRYGTEEYAVLMKENNRASLK